MRRLPQVDALRGLMLVLMTLTHMPTRFSDPLGQPLGFVSAAEGFVFLSAFLVAYVGTGRAQMQGVSAMSRWLRHRLGAVYACHVCLLAFLFLVAVPIGAAREQPAITDLASHFLHSPSWAVIQSLTLLYNPPLLDILPLYIVFLAATPSVLNVAQRRGWPLLLAGSASLWMLSQVGAGQMLFDVLAYATGVDLPYGQTGSFSFLGWQMMWMLGLWMGHAFATKPSESHRPPEWVGIIAVAYAAVCFIWRHTIGQVPEPHGGDLNLLFDKWTLGPMRLFDFLSLAVAFLAFAPRNAHWLLPSWLEWLGRAALPAFCAHLVVCLMALALVGAANAARPVWIDIGLLAAAFASMFVAAGLAAWARSRPGVAKTKRAHALGAAD
jgi:hypothetical protein